mgnify:FL=1
MDISTDIRSYTKRKIVATHKIFFYRELMKIAGRETDMRECKECHEILPTGAFTTCGIRGDEARYLKKICRTCHSLLSAQRKRARKNATPKPDNCDCCHERKSLTLDHDHVTGIFRGWLCRGCNTGQGALGDNLEAVLQCAIYLEKNKDKLIETLHKVLNK